MCLSKEAAEGLYDSGKEMTVQWLMRLDAKVDELTEEIARLKKNSSNSSKPPSSDITKPPVTRAERRREDRKRKKGGQLGHTKWERTPFSSDEVKPVEYFLEQCPDCNGKLQKLDDKPPRVQQQLGFVHPAVEKIEHRANASWCARCGKVHYAAIPKNVLREGLFRPDVAATVCFLKYMYVLTEKDGEGDLTSYEYDSQGRMVARIDALNRRTGYVLDARGQTLAEVDPDGDSTKYSFDNYGNQVMAISALGDTTRSTYNVFDKLAAQTDALGNVTRFEYDLFGQLKKTVAADSTFTQRTYDGQGNVKTSTDEMGRVTTFEYDHENRLVKTIFPDNSFTEVEYDSRGRRTASIDRNGNVTQYGYDDAGNNTVVRDALGHETTYEYDQSNRRTAMVDALGQRTEYLYDDHDRLVRTTFADGTYKTVSYDDAGRKVAETDQAGNTTAFAYDSVGNLRSVTDAMGYVTSYGYDSNNNRISQTDANGNTTTMAYDALNRLVRRTYPNADAEEFGYDANSNMVFKVDGEGDSTVYAFDSRNRETLRRYTNSGHTVRTVYTSDSRRDSVIDHRGVTTYQWGDCCGQLVRVDNPDGTFIEYEYDLNKNKTAMITPWARTEYRVDALNRMDSVIANNGDVTEYRYNAVGNRDSVIQYGNGTSTGYQYDQLNRLTKVANYGPGGAVLSSFDYELNNAGIRTAVTEADGSRVDYGYDALHRLTGETRTGTHPYSISYVYDNIGNRLSQTRDGVTTRYTYNNRDQLETESGPSGTTTYSYDAAGRLTEKVDPSNGYTYTWADNDRLVEVLGSTTNLAYEYDAEGIKVSAIDNGVSVNYLVDKGWRYAQVVAEYDNTLAPSVKYTLGLERIRQDRGGVVSFFAADGQGSTRQLTDNTGTITDTYGFLGFGEVLEKTGSTENNFLFNGEALDEGSGFYYLRARYMDPVTARFVSVDPFKGKVGVPMSQHRYLYARQSPVNYEDPTGMATMVDMATTTTVNTNIVITYNVVVQTSIGAAKGAVLKTIVGGAIQVAALAKIGWDYAKVRRWKNKADRERPLRLQHYTTEDGKNRIEASSGILDPAKTRGGIIFFSPDVYTSSTEATEDLAVDPEREYYVSLNMYYEADELSGPRSPIAPKTYERDDGTMITRRGGGTEYWTSAVIPTYLLQRMRSPWIPLSD